MSKIDHLQKMLSGITNEISSLKQLIQEKEENILTMEKTYIQLQETITAEKLQLNEYELQMNRALEMKTERDKYFKQIEQNIDTLMTILTTSRT